MSAERFSTLDEFHVDRHFHLQHIYAIAIFAKLAHALSDDVRFFLGVFQTFFIRTFVVADELEKIGYVIGAAFITDALHPSMFLVIHVLRIKRRVVEQNFDAVGAIFLQPLYRAMRKQIRQAAGAGLVVSGLFIGKQ